MQKPPVCIVCSFFFVLPDAPPSTSYSVSVHLLWKPTELTLMNARIEKDVA